MAFNQPVQVTEETNSSSSGHLMRCFSYVMDGDEKGGKSSIVKRFIKNEFSDSYTVVLYDVDWCQIVLDQKLIRLMITDFSAMETWRSFRQSSYKRADGFIIVYDVTSRESFDSVKWRVRCLNGEVVKCLVGNKCDLKDDRVVTYLEGKELADKLGIYFIETSAKDGTNVEQVFILLASAIVKQKEHHEYMRYLTLFDNKKRNQRRLTCCCKIS